MRRVVGVVGGGDEAVEIVPTVPGMFVAMSNVLRTWYVPVASSGVGVSSPPPATATATVVVAARLSGRSVGSAARADGANGESEGEAEVLERGHWCLPVEDW